jgi:hypothetical protein
MERNLVLHIRAALPLRKTRIVTAVRRLGLEGCG